MDDHQNSHEHFNGTENWHQLVPSSCLNAFALPALGDLVDFGRSTCWRSVTNWNQACDNILPRLTSYISQTEYCRQHCLVGDNIQECGLGLFQNASFPADLNAALFTCAQMIVCSSQNGTVRFCVRLLVPQQNRLTRHATHHLLPFGPSTQLDFCCNLCRWVSPMSLLLNNWLSPTGSQQMRAGVSGGRRGDVLLTCREALRLLRASMTPHVRTIYPNVPIIRTNFSKVSH